MSATAVQTWLQENLVQLSGTDPDASLDDLEPLRDIIGDARLVGIGEPAHFLHEYYELKHRILRFLVERMGFTIFGFESAWSEGLAVDRWLQTGDGRLDPLLLDGITNRMGGCEEMRAQLEWMRQWNTDPSRGAKLHYAGFDMSFWFTTPPVAIAAAFAYLDKMDPAFAEALRPQVMAGLDQFVQHTHSPAPTSLAPIPFESFDPLFGLEEDGSAIFGYRHMPAVDYFKALGGLTTRYQTMDDATRQGLTATLSSLVTRFEDRRIRYIAESSSEEYEIARQHAVMARFTDAFYVSHRLAGWHGSNVRDLIMAETTRWILDHADPGARMVISAHNGHLQKCRAGSFYPPHTTVQGEFLADWFGADYVVIGTTCDRGQVWGTELAPGDGTIDRTLAEAGARLALLDVSKIPQSGSVHDGFEEVRTARENHVLADLDWRQGFDALIHVDEVSHARLLG